MRRKFTVDIDSSTTTTTTTMAMRVLIDLKPRKSSIANNFLDSLPRPLLGSGGGVRK